MDKKKLILLIIITVLAFIIRGFYLSDPLWYDEACSWHSAVQDFPFGILNNLFFYDLQHTPLYFLILHLWNNIFGDSVLSMRFLSLLFGLASIPLIYIFSKKVFKSEIIGVLSALVMCASPLIVIFSVEVRMYSMVTFLVLLSLNYLCDFDATGKNLIKLLITNVLIPYTFVGAIFYNIALFFAYGFYLYKNKKELVKRYIIFAFIEMICLVPYWLLIIYYALKRKLFVISHEGPMFFIQVVDIIRNFFAVNVSENVYWPSAGYNITFLFALTVVIPCVYFIVAIVKANRICDNFQKCLLNIAFFVLCLFAISSLMRINVCTVRYIVYILPLLFCFGIWGLVNCFGKYHGKIFLSLFLIFCTFNSVQYSTDFREVKFMSLKAVAAEAKKLNLNSEDILIIPFGSDSPYYFRSLSAPFVYNFDFHKEVRNPNNHRYYDADVQDKMSGKDKYSVIFEQINSGNVISASYYNDFENSVNNNISKGHFVLVALYGSDANSVVNYEKLKNLAPDVESVKSDFLGNVFRLYLYSTFVLLEKDFNFIKSYKQGNYSYYLFQKK